MFSFLFSFQQGREEAAPKVPFPEVPLSNDFSPVEIWHWGLLFFPAADILIVICASYYFMAS